MRRYRTLVHGHASGDGETLGFWQTLEVVALDLDAVRNLVAAHLASQGGRLDGIEESEMIEDCTDASPGIARQGGRAFYKED